MKDCSKALCSLGCSVTLGKKYIRVGLNGNRIGAQKPEKKKKSKNSMPLNSLVVVYVGISTLREARAL